MKEADLNDYLFWNDELVKVIGINPGSKSIIMEAIDDAKCPHCGESLGKRQFEIIESSPLFQECATPIKTITSHP